MWKKNKWWVFAIILLINAFVIFSFFYFTGKIRNDSNLKIDGTR